MKTVDEFLKLNYRESVYKDEDGDFVVVVDDLPGCVTHGATKAEAFENVEEAKRAWMESRVAAGLEIPRPRSREEYSGRVLVRMPRTLHRALSNQAQYEGVSLNQHIVSLLSAGCTWGQGTHINILANANSAFTYGTLNGGRVVGTVGLCEQSYNPVATFGIADSRQSFAYTFRDALDASLIPPVDQQVPSRRGAA